MIVFPYEYTNEVSGAKDFVRIFCVEELFKKIYGIDIDDEQDIYDVASDEEIIAALLSEMDGFWNYEWTSRDHGDTMFQIFKLDMKVLKQELLKIFPRDYFTDKFIADITAEKV